MPVTKVLARSTKAEINTGTDASPIWTEIKGLNTIGPEPKMSEADTTAFDSNGRDEHLVASRGMSLTLEGFRYEDEATGARDPGQQAVETLGDAVGTASLGQFRLTSPGGRTWTFKASADVTPMGGGNNDASSWSAKLTVSGAITKV